MDTLFNLLESFLKKNNYQIDSEEFKVQLMGHPSYPSLHSVTGVLNHFGFDNIALQVPTNQETLEQLPENFISTDESANQYLLVTKKEDQIEILDGNKERRILSVSDFLESWGGIVVAVEPQKENLNHKLGLKHILTYGPGVLCMFILVALFIQTKPSPFDFLYFFLSSLGLILSIYVVNIDLGYHSMLTQKICNSNKATSCDAVLRSNGAILFGNLKISDLSLIYFSSLLLSTIVHVVLHQLNSSMAIVGVAATLITPYTIYYQWKVVKKWCPLCLAITSVLWIQFLISIFWLDSIPPWFDLNSARILIFCFFMAFSLLMLIRPLMQKKRDFEKLTLEHLKFKRNFDLFFTLYNKNSFIETGSVNEHEIILGEGNGTLQLVLITNPSCYYCKSAHKDMVRLLDRYRDKLAITIRFNVPSDVNAIANKTAKKLIQIYHFNSKKIEQALDEVYSEDVDLENWLSKWDVPSIDSYEQVLRDEKRWCNDHKIHFTPALYLNGKEYPKMYDRSDLQYFIEDLVELNEESLSVV